MKKIIKKILDVFFSDLLCFILVGFTYTFINMRIFFDDNRICAICGLIVVGLTLIEDGIHELLRFLIIRERRKKREKARKKVEEIKKRIEKESQESLEAIVR